MMNERKIKQFLRQAPTIEPPEGLYEQIKNELGIQPPVQKKFFAKSVFGIPHFATVMLLVVATTALGSGIVLVGNMIRWGNWENVPTERRNGVNEPIVYHTEDVAPLSQDELGWLRGLYQRVDLRSQAGEKLHGETLEILSDGHILDYWRWPAEKVFGKNMKYQKFYTTFHPNDFRPGSYYNEDGSPLLIKYVKPLHRDHVTTRGVIGSTTDSTKRNVNYEFGYERPRSKYLWSKGSGSMFWKVKQIDSERWSAAFPAGVQNDVYDFFTIELRLPTNAKVLETKPTASLRIDAQSRPIVTFDGKIEKGDLPPMEITYQLPNK